jgi:hypothetical protein
MILRESGRVGSAHPRVISSSYSWEHDQKMEENLKVIALLSFFDLSQSVRQ